MMKEISNIENKLLKRKEIRLLMHSSSNPGFQVSSKVAEHFKVSPELIVVKNVKSGFGKSEFLVDVFLYSDAEAMRIEPKPKAKKPSEAGK